MFGSDFIKAVPNVKAVLLATLESYPPKIAIRVIGEAPNSGWNPEGRLVPYVYFVPPADGIYEFDLVSESPEPSIVTNPVITEVGAFHVIDSIPPSFSGVKIYGANGFKVAMLDDPAVSFTGAYLLALGAGSSGGG